MERKIMHIELKFILHTLGICGSCTDGVLHQQGNASDAIDIIDARLPFPLFRTRRSPLRYLNWG